MKLSTVREIGFSKKPFHDMVVFDLETTGLSSKRDEIIQIAAMRIIEGEIQPSDFFFSYIKPHYPKKFCLNFQNSIKNHFSSLITVIDLICHLFIERANGME
jgi:DNA polymerase III alpha subunit (gram-positive type)